MKRKFYFPFFFFFFSRNYLWLKESAGAPKEMDLNVKKMRGELENELDNSDLKKKHSARVVEGVRLVFWFLGDLLVPCQ